jgi:hypothetical protein
VPGLKTIIDSLKRTSGDAILSRVDRMLLQRNEATTEIEEWLHPSAMVPWKKGWEHVCPRELFYTRFAPIGRWPKELLYDDFDPRFFRIVDNGQWVHRRWQAYLIQAGMVDPALGVGWEIPVYDSELGILGHADAIVYPEASVVNRVEIEFYDHGVPKFNSDGSMVYHILSNGGKWLPYGEPVVADIKSIKDEYWRMLHSAPQPEHAVQMTCYMALLKIKKTHLIYECKNTQFVKEIVLRLDLDRWAKFRSILVAIARAKKEKRLPERICRSAVVQRAQECPWVDACFGFSTYKQLVTIKGIEHGKEKKSAARVGGKGA